jgi:large subunit ribosomal protein L24
MNKIKSGDEIIVIAGKDKSKRGIVLSRTDDSHLLIEGVNVAKKHTKPNPAKNVVGGILDKAMPIHQSNVAIFNAATGKADRVGIKTLADGTRVRTYKSSGEEIKSNLPAKKVA